MSKYKKLTDHLQAMKWDEWEVSFQAIEDILGFPLPASARSHQAWWSNQKGDGHSQSAAWQSAGWRTGALDLSRERVVFFRTARSTQVSKAARTEMPKVGLTIAEAKEGLAAHYAVSPDNIEITIRG